MSADQCKAALNAAPDLKRAEHLDAAFPKCACEPWALTAAHGPGIPNEELVARVLTSPDAYEEATSTILSSKLTHIYSLGMSVIRQGASDDEIKHTVHDLLSGGSEPRHLIGAVVANGTMIRAYGNEDDAAQWFGLYATDDRGKLRHGDVFGTTVSKGQQQKRRHRLAADMQPLVVPAADVVDLISKLRAAGM